MNKTWFLCAACLLPLAAAATHPQLPTAAVKASARPGPTVVQPGELKWQDVPEMGPGIQAAVLSGNPDVAGSVFTMRAKFADGFKVPPHWHPAEESFTVLQGNFMLGMGSKWDDAKLVSMPQGAFVSLPKGLRHFATAKGETVLELFGRGPFKTILVDPPKKSK
jgi:quercetin dioxygenase-like cupin family protein